MQRKYVLPVVCIALLSACNNSSDSTITTFKNIDVKYPVTKKDTTVKDDYFGTAVADPYRWLENDTSAETAAWVKAENDVTHGYFSQIPFRDAIRKRYEKIFNYEKYSAPFRQGKHTYYYKNSGLQNQSVLYREADGSSAPDTFLDPNTFSKDGTTSLAGIAFSKDGSMAAYNISEGGSDWQKLVVMNAADKKQLADTLEIKFSGASWKGNDGFYYCNYERPKQGSVLSGKNESHKLYYHKLGTSQKEDKLVYGSDASPVRYMGGYLSEDERWLFISTANETYGGALFVQDLSKPNSPVVPIVADMKNNHAIVDVDDQY
ncbi:MAG TPA: hypothetical protein PLG91_13940, partial [Ferruginibacter sp.]|nr:hypothetical protein [Ferruginibacter sp.]